MEQTSTAVSLPTRDGAILSLSILGRSAAQTDFLVSVKLPWVHASREASTYAIGPPSLLFTAMAADWRGWEAEKRWEDLESRVSLLATSDKTRHVFLQVILVGPNYRDRADVILNYEAGQLDVMSRRVAQAFASDLATPELLSPNPIS